MLRLSESYGILRVRMGSNNEKPQYPEGFEYSSNNHFVNEDNIKIYCHYWKPKCYPKVLVFISHGAGEHCQRYEHVAAALTEIGAIVYAHDHVGHGLSEGERLHIDSMEKYYRDVAHHVRVMIDKYPNLPSFIVGHSVGGTIAVGSTLKYPELFHAMVLIAPALMADPDSASRLRLAMGRFMSWVSPQTEVSEINSDYICRDPQVVKSYAEDPLITTGLKARWTMCVLDEYVKLQKQMPDIKIPYICYHGDCDKIVPKEGSQLLQEKSCSVDKTLAVYEGGYHQLHNEPDEMGEQCIENITNWIEEQMTKVKVE